MDRQIPSVSVPVSHRIVAGMAIVTMTGSSRMVRRCFHDGITDPSRAPVPRHLAGPNRTTRPILHGMGIESPP